MDKKDFLLETIRIKGEIIHYVSLNEYHINYIISDYINSDKMFLCLAIMNKLNFNSRLEIFKVLLEQKDIDYKSKYPDLISNLDKLQVIRNKFAHSMSQVPAKDDYLRTDEFFLLKTDKFDALDFAKTAYSTDQHKINLALLLKILAELTEISGLK